MSKDIKRKAGRLKAPALCIYIIGLLIIYLHLYQKTKRAGGNATEYVHGTYLHETFQLNLFDCEHMNLYKE